MGLIVQKFGGTSVADSEKIKNVANAVIKEKLNGNDVVVVVSAMGHTTDNLIKLSNSKWVLLSKGCKRMNLHILSAWLIHSGFLSILSQTRYIISLTMPESNFDMTLKKYCGDSFIIMDSTSWSGTSNDDGVNKK